MKENKLNVLQLHWSLTIDEENIILNWLSHYQDFLFLYPGE